MFITATSIPAVGTTGTIINSNGSYKSAEIGNVYAISLGDGGSTNVDFRALATSDFSPSSGLNPLLACANRGHLPDAPQIASSAVLMKAESRKSCSIGGAPISEMRLSYANFYIANGTGTEISPGNAVNLAAAIEINGFTVQITFTQYSLLTNQATTTICGISGCISMANGATDVVSDGIYPWQFGLPSFSAGMTFFVREMRTVPALNNTFTKHLNSAETGEATCYCDPTVVTTSQLLSTGVITAQSGGAAYSCQYGPVVIAGRAIGTPDIAVVLIGDSLIDATGDTGIANSFAGSGNNDGGFCMRALWNLNGRNVPVSKVAVGGSSIYWVANAHAGRRAFWKYFTHALVGYGTNDGAGNVSPVQTAAQAMNNLNTLFNSLKGGDSNIRHIAANLIINRVTTTDSGATTANQTPLNGFGNGGVFRQPLNTLIQNNAYNNANALDEFIDISGPCSDSVFTDRWPAGVSTDGVHPYGNTVQAALAAIVASHVTNWV